MMPPYDPFAFSQPPEDAVTDTDAMLDLAAPAQGYVPQENMPFLENNTDLPPSDVDPRGMLRDSGTGAPSMGVMPDAVGGEPQMGAPMDEEALRLAILENGTRDNEMSDQYQTGVVEQNEEEERRLAKMNGGM